MDSTQFSYIIEGDETKQVRHTRSGKWLLDDTDDAPAMPAGIERYFAKNRAGPVPQIPTISANNAAHLTDAGEIRYTCPCCGGETKRPVGYCGHCLL